MDMKNNVRTQGLTESEVAQSRQQHGENVLTPPKRKSLWRLYLEKYDDPIIRILLVAAAISLCLAFVNGEYIETIGIILAIFFATTVGFYFERDAARKFSMLTALGEEQRVKVVRSGKVVEIARREVVVGDVVLIETGDEVPADGELFESTGLQVDESSLTGEPMANKHPRNGAVAAAAVGRDSIAAEGAAYPPYLLLRSSMVMAGQGRMMVTAVGDQTEIGKVAREATEISQVKTPLNLQLDRLASLISKIGSAVSAMAFLGFLLHDMLTNDLWATDDYVGMAEVVLRYFMMAVTLIVMAVPEGLPMAVTLALALNMRRMLQSNNLVRKLQASETMGAVTVICTDKTGTLTQNRMTVTATDTTNGQQLMEEAALNSTAELNGEEGIGNPTEVALLRACEGYMADYRQLRAAGTLVDREPFSTEKKYMASLWQVQGRQTLYVKGAAEVVLPHCDMSEQARQEAIRKMGSYQRQGMRVLAFAHRYDATSLELGRLSYTGFVAISDPVRPDVPKAIADCRHAGIDVKIVTGDNSLTAIEIARQIGLFGSDAPVSVGRDSIAPVSVGRDSIAAAAITGPEFAALTDEEALQRTASLKVMSRARPTDKQRLVQLLQQRGEVVAVTGDGTNDAPALNHAHVGLSLGSGTSVAKEASDITIIDDSFRSVVRAVEWGRSLYKNIQRFIFFQLVVNVTALLLVLGGSIIGTELPLTVTQILWINLIMDTFAAMALASLPPSHEVLNAPPRKATDFIISHEMMRGIGGLGLLFFAFTFAYLYWLENNVTGQGVSTYELTKFFTVFVMLQWWNLFNARTLGSRHSAFHHFFWGKGFVLVLVLILLGQWLIVTLGGDMFRTVPLSAHDWLQIAVGTMPVMLCGELYRLYQRKKR